MDEAVALGAAISAGLNASSSDLSASRKILRRCQINDVSNHYFGTGMLDWDENLKKHYVKNDILIPRAKTYIFNY